MRKLRTAVLTGIAVLAAGGIGFAAGRDAHEMKVDLPDGSIARIEYKGDVTPKVSFGQPAPAVPVAFPGALDASPFETFDRIAADMERQTAAMVHEVGALQAMPSLGDGKADLAALSKLPPGTMHYQFVSISDGRRTCDRRIDVTAYGPDQKPKIVSTSSGDCKALAPAPALTSTPARSDQGHSTAASKA